MNVKLIAATVIVFGLVGCQRSEPVLTPVVAPPIAAPPAEPQFWGRLDCKRAATNPEVQAEFTRDKGFCERAAGLRDGDGVTAELASCMGDRGYSYRTRDQHDSYCARTQRSAQRR